MSAECKATRTVNARRSRFIAIVAIASAAACHSQPSALDSGQSGIAGFAANFAQAAAAVTGQDAPMADDYTQGHYVGFDTHTYPGTPVMRAWKNAPGAPYSWVGFYLPSPCHANASWSGKRDTLESMGWGVAVVYVGQQTWGHTPRSLTPLVQAALRKRSNCSTNLVSASEGQANADDAAHRATVEGFPAGAVIFLDLERMETIPPAMRDYYRAWVARMLASGRYRPGIYAHQHNAQQIFTDVQDAFTAAGDTEPPRFWIAGGKDFDEGRAPQDVGFAFAGVWQGVIDVARSVANLKLPVDVNVASWRSPSASGVAVQ